VKTGHRNVTFNLPEPLLRRFRVYAAERNRSMTDLVADAMDRMMSQESEREKAAKRLIERMRNAPNRGTGGVITWKREDLYDRQNEYGRKNSK